MPHLFTPFFFKKRQQNTKKRKKKASRYGKSEYLYYKPQHKWGKKSDTLHIPLSWARF